MIAGTPGVGTTSAAPSTGFDRPATHGVQAPVQRQPQHLDPPISAVVPQRAVCQVCGGAGARLDPSVNVCQQCDWIRPLAPKYRLDPSAFQWAQDGIAMEKLRSIGPLNAAARAVSDKVGRPWIEGLFNAVRVSEKQLPRVYEQAVLAARILNLPQMPDVYVSGERMWEAATYGSDRSAFVVLGTALVTSFQGDDLLFLLAREMGHCRAGHALWKTVIRFMIGEQRSGGGLMGGGILSLLDLTKLVEGAVELPLLAWARQSEITADRAGLIAVRDEHVARRVLLTWCLKSAFLFKQINVAEWMKQQEDSEDQVSRLSEVAMSPTPYIARRLRLLAKFARGPQVDSCRKHIGPLIDAAKLALQTAMPTVSQPSPSQLPVGSPPSQSPPAQGPTKDDALRLQCAACGTGLHVPRNALQDKEILNVRCSNPQCKNVLTLKKQSAAALVKAPTATAGDLRLKCSGCGSGIRVPRSAMAGKDGLTVRCPNIQCHKTMTLKKKSVASATTTAADLPRQPKQAGIPKIPDKLTNEVKNNGDR